MRLGGPRTAMLASLMMMGLMPISNATLASPPPLTPEQIKAQAKRERKAAKRKESNDGQK